MDEDGRIRPLSIQWEDGRWYSVDKVVAVVPAIAWPFGGQGTRYEVWIDGRHAITVLAIYNHVVFADNGGFGNDSGKILTIPQM